MALTAIVTLLIGCGWSVWHVSAALVPRPVPAPYPGTTATVTTNHTSASIITTTHTRTYAVARTFPELHQHYMRELTAHCQSRSIEAFVATARCPEGQHCWRAACYVQGWIAPEDRGNLLGARFGRVSVYPYQRFEVFVMPERNGVFKVIQIEEYAVD